MSWDLFVADIPTAFRTTDDVPDDWRPPVIGSGRDLIERIKAVFPNADFSAADWGRIEGDGYSIEVAFSAEETEMTGFMLFVRGGEEAAYAVAELVRALGLRAFDTGAADGAIFPGPDITAGWRAWRSFRDRVIDG